VALPSFTEWIRNTQVRSIAEALQNGIRLAQTEAVRRNQDVVMSFTNDSNPTLNPTAVAGGRSWAIQTVAKTYINNNVAEFIRAGVFADMASGVGISGVVTGTATPVLAICFNASGRLLGPTPSSATADCVANPVTFQVSQSGSDRPLNVTVAVGGQVRMCDPNRPALSATSPDGCPP
jgi:type IV fimbrial biogenesis protein FimT